MDTTVVLTTVGGPWLTYQLEALAAQTQPPAQLVLVNNGPAGAVTALADQWVAKLPQLELVEDRALALCGYARNVGAARARSPGLLFLDDDDVVDGGYVEAMSRALDSCEIVAARIDLEKLNAAGLTRRWGVMQARGPMLYHDFLPWVIGGALGVRRATFADVGGFDTSFKVCEDTDFCWRAQLAGGAGVAFVPEAVVSYRLRSEVRPAFRQARLWASWEVALRRRYALGTLGRPGVAQRTSLLRWARPLLVLAQARRREDLVFAARLLGNRVGQAEGAVRHRRVQASSVLL